MGDEAEDKGRIKSRIPEWAISVVASYVFLIVAVAVVLIIWDDDHRMLSEKLEESEAHEEALRAERLAAWQFLSDHGELADFLEWLERTNPPPLIVWHNLTDEQIEYLTSWPTLTKRLTVEEAEEEYG